MRLILWLVINFVCSSVLATDAVSIPVHVVATSVRTQVVQPTMPAMTAPPVDVPRSKYADAPDVELQRSADDPSIRFLLALPNQLVPVLVEAWIDGKPFRKAREERIVKIMAGDESDPLSVPYRKYCDVTKREASSDEVRWLFRRWGEDASLVALSKNFERSRASQSPVLDVLDLNNDGLLDHDEIAISVETLVRCDTNRDDVIEFLEIQNAANSLTHNHPIWSPPQLMIPVEDATSLTSEQVAPMSPQITVSVRYTSESGECSVQATSLVEVRNGSSMSKMGGAVVEVTAIRGSSPNHSDQISLGVVNDGYPIEPLLDSNEDGRLTNRELREVVPRLNALDLTQDGRISSDELLPTIRVAIGHGLCVHDLLSTVRSVYAASDQPKTIAPDWFASLDKNRDGDISQKEFVGTAEQFANMDHDLDGLIDVTEAGSPPNPSRETKEK